MKPALYEALMAFNPHSDLVNDQAFEQYFHELISFADESLAQPIHSPIDIERVLGNHDATVLMMAGWMEYLFSARFTVDDNGADFNLIEAYLAAHPDLEPEQRDWLHGLRQSYMSVYTLENLTETTVTLVDAILPDSPHITLSLDEANYHDMTGIGWLAARVVTLPDRADLGICWLPLHANIVPDVIKVTRQMYAAMLKLGDQLADDITPEEAERRAKSLWCCVIMGHWMVHAAISEQVRQEEAHDAARQKKKAHNLLSVMTGKPIAE